LNSTSETTFVASDEDLHPWFFGGEAPPQTLASWDKISGAAVMLHWPMWSLSELERQQNRASAKGAPTEKVFDSESGGKNHYIKGKKINQMRDWILSLSTMPEEKRAKMTPYERIFCRTFYLKVKRYQKGVKWVSQKQYELLREIAARYLVPASLNTLAASLDTSTSAENSNPVPANTISLSQPFKVSSPESESDCSLSELKEKGWEEV
jgi:hypothetical protein